MTDMHSLPETPVSDWGRIDVERLGGLAGYGSPGARLRSRGSVLAHELNIADQAILRDIAAAWQEFSRAANRLLLPVTQPEHGLPADVVRRAAQPDVWHTWCDGRHRDPLPQD